MYGVAADLALSGETYRAEARCHIVRLSAPAMGTRFELVMIGADPVRLRSAGEAALAEVCALSEKLSAFSPGSALSHINHNAADRPVQVDRELFALLEL